MRCLCCGQILSKDSEINSGWHDRCIRNFFGTASLPDIDVSTEFLDRMADEAVSKSITVTGVQKKLSLHLSNEKEARLTVVDYPTGYILKPQAAEYRHLPEYEHTTMSMAEVVGIKTVPHALIKTGDSLSYITKRIDRRITNDKIEKFAMEDFCQLSGKLTSDKYRGSYEQCGKVIDHYSSQKGFDMSELFIRVFFSFITGNSDMHLKNFSLIEEEAGSGNYSLSRAYDLIPVNIVLPEDIEETALTLNGKKRNIVLKDMRSFAERIGLSDKVAIRLMHSVTDKSDEMMAVLEESALDEEEAEAFKTLITSRINRMI